VISADVIANVRDRLGDADATMFASAEMTRHLDAAALEYSGYRPYMTNTTITSVEGQKIYDLPAGCSWVSRVWLTNADSETTDTINDILIEIRDYIIDYGESRWRSDLSTRLALAGQPVAWMWNRQLYLYPASTQSGDTINVDYAGLHSKDGSGNYTTVPACDALIIEELMLARCYEAIAADMAKRPDYTEGQSKVVYSIAPNTFLKMAAQVRWKVQGQLSEDVGVVA
jgi:hypothetical protein